MKFNKIIHRNRQFLIIRMEMSTSIYTKAMKMKTVDFHSLKVRYQEIMTQRDSPKIAINRFYQNTQQYRQREQGIDIDQH